jgi:hypothetical protein
MSRPVCSECGEAAQQSPPTSWIPAWGPAPSWSHHDGDPLCNIPGTNHAGESSYVPCEPEFV